MKKFGYLLLTLLALQLILQRCANPGSPTGGPKDTLSPTLIYSTPANGSINYTGNIIEMEFSEFINADKLLQQLIITPKTDIRYKSFVKRNKLILKLDGKLKDSTTYNFNFADGVTDITENNPVVNLSLAFSTGPTIDSMGVKGHVEDLLSKEPGIKYVVGLYPASDTINYFSDHPLYFTTANDTGNYSINYVKQGNYRIVAFNDENKNYLMDPETESHGFLAQDISLDSIVQLNPIRSVLQNIKPIKLVNTRSVGRYVEIKFNKHIHEYSLNPTYLTHNVIGENNDVIRIYQPENYADKDSIQAIIVASDSLRNTITDTIKFSFYESNRQPSKFNLSFNKNRLPQTDNPSVSIHFTKPVSTFDSSYAFIQIDSTLTIPIPTRASWNSNNTKATVTTQLSIDSIKSQFDRALPFDSAMLDSGYQRPLIASRTVNLTFAKGSFISVENDTLGNKSIQLKQEGVRPSGVLNIYLATNYSSYILQLIDRNDKVSYQSINQSTIRFASIKPETYTIRILIDTNEDGQWSYGNLLQNLEPENVYLYPDPISVRENWVIDLDITLE